MPYRPHISGAMGTGTHIYSTGGNWKGLRSGFGYRKPAVDRKTSGLKTLKNGGQGNGKPVLVHKGELVIGNPYRRRP